MTKKQFTLLLLINQRIPDLLEHVLDVSVLVPREALDRLQVDPSLRVDEGDVLCVDETHLRRLVRVVLVDEDFDFEKVVSADVGLFNLKVMGECRNAPKRL